MSDLTPGFVVIDYQATPSGYYQIAFRSDAGTIVATQHGRGGSVLYTPWTMMDEFTEWLDANAQIAIDDMTELGYPDLARTVIDRGLEWGDIVVMAICDLIDMGKLRVIG